ncbi:MAG: N-6 DNA methylase [Candidatus Bilamarchaeum sp.]
MANEAASIVQKVWNYCNVLRDDGVSYGDYVEQLTYLLFLKIVDEQSKPPFNKTSSIPKEFDWQALLKKEGDELELQYRHTLENLGKQKGMLGVIFRKAQNKIQDPAKLKRLIQLIEGETWSGMDLDVKGEIYEGLLQKNAEDTKSGAGQYFTPRALINSIIKVVRPESGKTICDPACGTGGFLLSAYHYMSKNPQLDKEQRKFLRYSTFKGWELVDSTARLCVMNMYLHGIGGEESPIVVGDSLSTDPGDRFDYVLTNPPFGKKSSITIVNSQGEADKEAIVYERQDFAATTSNKQLNFLQHIKTLLKINGKAAVVVPDNVLFEGGAGETIRKRLLSECDVHTLLRLPTGLFYAQGVKANVIFFDKKPAREKPWTDKVWIYDLRTNKHFTLKSNSLSEADLEDFVNCYNPLNKSDRKETDRFKVYSYEDIVKRDKTNLDIFWLKDESLEDSENLPDPAIIAAEIKLNLESALTSFENIENSLK